MPYTLEIHHIDIGLGDSTLILVRDEANANAITQSCLIDGGLGNAAAIVDAYVTGQNVVQLNSMIASHYDKDHYYGLTALLEDAAIGWLNTVKIIDRGEVGRVTQAGAVEGRKNDFSKYVAAVARINTRTRPTGRTVPDRTQNLPVGFDPAYFPLEKTVFGLNSNPTMLCIAANKWVIKANGDSEFVVALAPDDNPYSLGFLIKHNNFRYFTAGDLTIPLEEAVSKYLNPNDNDPGHVCAIKANHHGANTSSSLTYMKRMRPRAVFISAGFGNTYNHPDYDAVSNIEASSNKIQYYYVTSCGSAHSDAYLLGCGQGKNQITQNSMARVAGDRPRNNAPANRGHIVLRVTDAQSQMNPHQFSVTYYEKDRIGGAGIDLVHHTC